MSRPSSTITAVTFATALAGTALAQQHDPKAHAQHNKATTASKDARELVALPPPMVDHMLANMRDHLVAIHEIQAALGTGHTATAASVAEKRLGMTSLESHGAQAMGQFMPKGMQQTGTAMHRAASRFALAAQEAGVSGDVKPALSALADITAQCNACHAGYRVR